MSEGSMDGALRAAFEPSESVLARLQRSTGVQSRILLHDAPGEESPLLRVGGTGGSGAEDDSRYRIVGEIAKGGVGVVYKARDRDLGRDVALKVLRKEHASNPEVLERLVEEAQIGGQLQHPGIVPVYGIGLQADSRPYFAMKLIKGRTLAAVLKERKDPLRDLPRFLRVFEQICQTIAYAHTRGVIHRDLKPSNVMVGGFGEVLVVDWGFGKVLGRDDPMAEKLQERTIVATVRSKGEGSESITGSVMGTPAYMPPEQALGQVETLDERCDVFALGAILCEILTGQPPYVGAPEDLLTMAAQARLDGANERLASCKADPALVEMCRRALAPLRADRPEDASAPARSLEEFLAAAEKRARDAEVRAVHERARLERERKEALWARRSKRKTMALAVAAVVAVILAGGAWLWRDGRRREHAMEIRQQAERALGEATRLLGAEKWDNAVAEARRARDIAAQSDLLADVRDDAESLAARAEAVANRVARRDRLVAALEESRMQRAELSDFFAQDDAGYLEAFARAGLDFAKAPVADLALAIRREYPDAIVDIASALDEWAWFRRMRKDQGWSRLDAVVREIDADPRRNELRDAIAAGDVARLRSMADQAYACDLPVRTQWLLGVSLGQAGDPAAAAFFLKLRDLHPDDFWVQFQATLYLGDLTQELECATAAVALRPNSPWAWNRLGLRLDDAGDRDGAIAAFGEAIRLRPEHAPSHYNLALSLRGEGNLDGAIAEYREAIRLGGVGAAGHSELGTALAEKGELEQAIAEHREAIRLRPDLAEAHYNLGNALRTRGDLDDAAATYREAIRIRPDFAEAYWNLGIVLRDQGRFKEAADAIRRGHTLGSPSREWVEFAERWAVLEERLPDVLGGTDAIRDAAERIEFAMICHYKGRYADAGRLCEEAFAEDADLLTPANCYNAACMAARAALQEAARASRWRGLALGWLRASLGAWAGRMDAAAADVAGAMEHWKRDRDVASVRDRIDDLPEDERDAWRKLWADVDALLAQAREAKR